MYGYQRGIAAAIGDPAIERVSVLKSARVGYTDLTQMDRDAIAADIRTLEAEPLPKRNAMHSDSNRTSSACGLQPLNCPGDRASTSKNGTSRSSRGFVGSAN